MRLWQDGTPHPIRNQVTTLGRDPSVDIAVLSAEVSRKHAFIVALGSERYLLMDFKSANGTRLNGRRIETALLKDGDQIDLAGGILTVEATHRRAGSMASTGHFKPFLDLEEARVGDEAASLVDFWNLNLPTMAALLPLVRQVRSMEGVAQVAAATLRLCTQVLAADRGLLLLLDDEGKLGVRAQEGFPQGRGIRRNLHQALIDEAVDNDRLVATREDFVASVFSQITSRQHALPDVSAAMAMPLTLCGSSVGAVLVERRRGRETFPSTSRSMLRFLAQLLGPQLTAHMLEARVTTQMTQVRIVEVGIETGGTSACEVCGEDLDGARPQVRCKRCDLPHHADCFEYIGRCAIYGCDCAEAVAA